MAPAGTTQAAAAMAKDAAGAVAADTAATMELASTLRLVIGRLDRRLRQHAIGGLTASQLSALAAIERHGPLPLGKLAKLEDQGFVVREADERDRRVTRVRVSDEGAAYVVRSRTLKNAYLAERLERLADAERRLLADALPVLERLVEDEAR
jgi:DNA-binding MarR family transcriptional regulator